MKKSYSLPSCLLLIILALPAVSSSQETQEKVSAEFRLFAPSLGKDSAAFICGSTQSLALWNPSKLRMAYSPDGYFYFKTEVIKGTVIQYKYTLGSWLRENANASGAPLSNFSVKVAGDTVIRDTVLFWKNDRKNPPVSTITGTLVYHRNIRPAGLKHRDVAVWLPPGYTGSGKRYPVLYMHDGQNLFNAAETAFGNEWRADETADSLIRAGIIDPVIIVGIYNTSDRMKEYVPGEAGDRYMNYILTVVKPFIDSTYRTKSDRKNTFTAGSSAGGAISFMLAWEHPEVFSRALCFSPAFKISSINLVDDVEGYAGKKKKIALYIDNGGKDLESMLQPGVDAMTVALKKAGYSEGKDLFVVTDPSAEHNEKAWAARLPGAMKLLLPPVKF